MHAALGYVPLSREAGEGPGERAVNKTLRHAKELRRNMTEAEQRLWHHLRAHRFLGLKFKRQVPVGPFIVDFACVERRLVVELDGSQHAEAAVYDRARDAWLASQGFTVRRFWNNDVLADTQAVLAAIHATLFPEPSPPAPLPLRGRGEE